MEKRMKGFRLGIATLLAVLTLALCGAAAADADPIRVSSLSEPQSVISEQDVSITIKIYNSSQTDMEEEITLFNPSGISVEKYSGLKGEQSVTYTGKWHVTQDQIEKGKISYYIQYTVDTGSGPQKATRTVPVTIQTEEAAPQLTATYSVSPASAREGQSVTLSYTLSNTGNVELRNIVIKNEGVTKETLAQPSLSVGEKVTLTDTFTMGSKELVSKPSISYQAADSSKTLTISDMARKTITVAEDGLDAALSAKNAEDVYPGEQVALTVSVKNTGSQAYTGLTATLSDGTEVFSDVELSAGASYEKEIEWTAAQNTTLSVTVSGNDGSGEPVSITSNEISVTTQDVSRALLLNVYADAAQSVINSEPAVVRFGVVVENVGETDAATLTITQGSTTVAKIPSLPSGESRTVVFDVETSIAGKFQFVVHGKDVDGNERTFESDILEIAYVAPTPTPTAVPTPSPVPPTPTPVPTATPAPTLGELIAQKVNPVVLYSVAGVLAALLVGVLAVSGVTSAKRKKRMAQAIDTIELSPDVRNHRGVARRRRQQAEKTAPKPGTQADEPIVPAAELTEEDTDKPESTTPARDAMRQLEREEGRRRRAAVEVPTDETLRVVPVDQRPEFIAQGKVDDSQTRIFGKLGEEVAQAAAAPKAAEPADVPTVNKLADLFEEAPAIEEQPAEKAGADQTIRLSRAQIEEIRQQQEPREDKYAGSGKKKAEIKPMKKKGLFSGFGKKKAGADEDDFEEDGGDDFDDDDLIE
ncbi:MAG: CARDB domain-containing protein [Candidatus Ventricola sp.]